MALLKSINYWSFAGGWEGTLDPIEAARQAKHHGFEAIELCVGEPGTALGLDASDATCARIRQESEALGIPILSVASALYWSRSLGDPDPALRALAEDDVRQMLRLASGLGARTLLVIPGVVEALFLPGRAPEPTEAVWERSTAALRRLLPVAEERGVRIGIENVWNKFLLSSREMKEYIDQYSSPWIGAYVDVANMLPYGLPQDWLRVLGPGVVGIHFKDFRASVGSLDGFVDLLEGDVAWPEVMAAMGDISYAGPVVAEMIPLYKHHPAVRVANASRAMDAILGRAA